MSESTNSTPHCNSSPTIEIPADMSLNHDEVLDMELALGSLGGLRHSAACDQSERSKQRYDDLNHRLYKSRMKRLGLTGDEESEGEESEEGDGMSHQVLIRSPVTHNHGLPPGQAKPQPDRSWLPWALLALAIPATVFAWQLPKLLTPPPVPPPADTGSIDTDTKNTLRPDNEP